MNQQNHADEQNPYEYEKPVSANKFRKYGSVATLGFIALGTAFGGNAIAATIMATDATTSTTSNPVLAEPLTTNPIVDALATNGLATTVQTLDANGAPIDSAIQIVQGDTTLAPVQSSPSATPTKSPIIGLPVLPVVDYGNLSSATPSGGSTSGGSAAGASWGGDDDDDRDDHDDRDDRDDHDDDNDREDNDDD